LRDSSHEIDLKEEQRSDSGARKLVLLNSMPICHTRHDGAFETLYPGAYKETHTS